MKKKYVPEIVASTWKLYIASTWKFKIYSKYLETMYTWKLYSKDAEKKNIRKIGPKVPEENLVMYNLPLKKILPISGNPKKNRISSQTPSF